MIAKEDIHTFNKIYRILIKADGFAYLLPHPALRNWISNYTITFPSEGMMSDRYAVVPHGSATLVLSCDGNRTFGNLFGPATRPAFVGSDANRFRWLFIVEFQPAGYYAFSGMPQKELTDFYDMPHFIHDFKSICGITPQEYRDNMSDFYSEIAKF